jgi:molybdenum cofactor biosynthesis enzyme MoaA
MSSRVEAGTDFLALRILLTEECNLSCVFCHNEGQRTLTHVSELDERRLKNLVCAGAARGLRQIKFSGGEPTLHHRLTGLVGVSVAAGVDTVVISNGHERDSLARAAEYGARISLNVPSVDAATYTALTGGSLAEVTETLGVLRGLGAEVALNSYARLKPDVGHMADMLAFARRFGCTLKLLLPCQVLTVTSQNRAHAAYEEALNGLQCRRERETPYDSSWVTADAVGRVRVVKPWCPQTCRLVSPGYRSVRLTARLRFRPCFGNADLSVAAELDTVKSCRASLDRALSLAMGPCEGHLDVGVRSRRGPLGISGPKSQVRRSEGCSTKRPVGDP